MNIVTRTSTHARASRYRKDVHLHPHAESQPHTQSFEEKMLDKKLLYLIKCKRERKNTRVYMIKHDKKLITTREDYMEIK